jgi:GNAT superfamily N-acetyltransferase
VDSRRSEKPVGGRGGFAFWPGCPTVVSVPAAGFSPSPFPLTLDDGTPVLLRPVGPADREAVLAAFARLSPDSRYYRFWTRQERLPDSILQRFLHADHVRQSVWAVLDPGRPEEPGHGAGSWWRGLEASAEAEVSFTVADEAQHRGVGTLLLAVLWSSARPLGITRFLGHALPDNHAVLDWFRALGARLALDSGQITMTLDLDRASLPRTRAADRLRTRLDEVSGFFADRA